MNTTCTQACPTTLLELNIFMIMLLYTQVVLLSSLEPLCIYVRGTDHDNFAHFSIYFPTHPHKIHNNTSQVLNSKQKIYKMYLAIHVIYGLLKIFILSATLLYHVCP